MVVPILNSLGILGPVVFTRIARTYGVGQDAKVVCGDHCLDRQREVEC